MVNFEGSRRDRRAQVLIAGRAEIIGTSMERIDRYGLFVSQIGKISVCPNGSL